MSGAPIGNKNAQKGQIWNDSLRKAIAQDDGRRLRASVEQLLNLASNEEPWAIKELADRLDGRPKQTNVLEASDEPELKTIKIVFVSPDGREADDVTNLNISN
jgi:predicted transcriptional regulator